MKYRLFEGIVLVVGGAAILGSVLLSFGAPLITEEVIAQLLLFGVLVGAVHWGRNGGFIAATIASLIYIVMRIPLVVAAEGLTADVVDTHPRSRTHVRTRGSRGRRALHTHQVRVRQARGLEQHR